MTLRHGARTPLLLPLNVQLKSARRAALTAAQAVAEGDIALAQEQAAALNAAAEREMEGRPKEPISDLQTFLPNSVAAAFVQLLVDLQEAGWRIEVDAGSVYASPPSLSDVSDDRSMRAAKSAVRGAMMGRVRESARSPSTKRLIAEMEPEIGQLLADPRALARSLEAHGLDAVRPYLQLARRADGADAITGLPLFSIFRYLRYWWSFPYRDTPGRSLPFLIRDAGQPGHPVCGLLNLASPVLRMAQRDDALGLTHRWLRQCALALRAFAGGQTDLATMEFTLRTASKAAEPGQPAVLVDTLWPQVEALLGVPSLIKAARRLAAPERVQRARAAAAAVLTRLAHELERAIRGISFEGLGEDVESALAYPADAAPRLALVGAEAAEKWKQGRAVEGHRRGDDLSRLFLKKRAKQLSELLSAWSNIGPVVERAADDAIEALVWGTDPGRVAHCSALATAIEARKVRLLSTQVADVSVCGALPPYNALLGGKLAALLALSREAAEAYHSAYDGVASDIQSRMAGEDVRRPAELLALTTTSFFSVGSAQYNRLSLPCAAGGLKWRQVGMTAGHGTLHLSERLVAKLSALLIATHGGRLISSTFGEGPSERLRKLRDGLIAVGLPADGLLVHGFPRIVYLSTFQDLFPGAPERHGQHHFHGPAAEEVVRWWGARWAGPRLVAACQALHGMAPQELLSVRFSEELLREADDPGETMVATGRVTSDGTATAEEESSWDTSFSEASTSATPATPI
jgi:hypothetical protein